VSVIVQKYGGTSVADSKRIKHVAIDPAKVTTVAIVDGRWPR